MPNDGTSCYADAFDSSCANRRSSYLCVSLCACATPPPRKNARARDAPYLLFFAADDATHQLNCHLSHHHRSRATNDYHRLSYTT